MAATLKIWRRDCDSPRCGRISARGADGPSKDDCCANKIREWPVQVKRNQDQSGPGALSRLEATRLYITEEFKSTIRHKSAIIA